MTIGPLTFTPVDLKSYEDVCVQFSEDAFVESFGDAKRFHEEDGKGSERYRVWLRERLAKDPTSVVLVWNASKIIGQVTAGKWKVDPSVGYVSLYYLIPEMRGKGIATQLLKKVCEVALEEGFDFVEAYPNSEFTSTEEDFMGTVSMFEKAGFIRCYEAGNKTVMRKALNR